MNETDRRQHEIDVSLADVAVVVEINALLAPAMAALIENGEKALNTLPRGLGHARPELR